MRISVLTLIFMIFLLYIGNPTFAELINRVIAVVNGEVITESELWERATKLVAIKKLDELDAEEEKLILRQALQDLIDDRLVLAYAKQKGIKVSKAEVEKRINAIKERFPTEMEFLQSLEEEGLSYEVLYEKIREDILKKKVINLEVRKKIEIHPDEIKAYYESHKDEFTKPARVKIVKICFKKEDNSKEKVEQVKELLSKGIPFEQLLANYGGKEESKGTWIEKGKFKEEVENVLFKLRIGEVSPIIETEGAFYIFQVLDKEEARLLPLSEVKDKVYEILYREKFKQHFDEFIARLKRDAHIEIKVQL